MAQSVQPGRFGHIVQPDEAWLAKQEREPILEPELPIIDTHHHLWDRGGWAYLLPELLADLNTGHNIVATVFEECRSMYRADGPVEMRPVGETEFVAGIAAMSASGGYGPIRVAQAIVGYADLALGDRVEPVLEALIRAGGGRLAGVRYSVGYDADPTIGNSRPDSAPHMYARAEIRAGIARLATHGLALDAWCYHPQLADVIALARAVPQATIVMCHVGGVLGYGAYAGKKDEVHAAWRASMAELATCPNVSVKLGGMLNRGAALNFRELPAPPNSPGPRPGGPMSRPASSCLARIAATSKAIFRSTRWAPATRYCGTRSSASPRDALRARSSPFTAARRSGSTTSTEAGRIAEPHLWDGLGERPASSVPQHLPR